MKVAEFAAAWQVHPHRRRAASGAFPVGDGPTGVVYDGASVWVAGFLDAERRRDSSL